MAEKFSLETVQVRIQWSNIFNFLKPHFRLVKIKFYTQWNIFYKRECQTKTSDMESWKNSTTAYPRVRNIKKTLLGKKEDNTTLKYMSIQSRMKTRTFNYRIYKAHFLLFACISTASTKTIAMLLGFVTNFYVKCLTMTTKSSGGKKEQINVKGIILYMKWYTNNW